jgi:adenylate cyclase
LRGAEIRRAAARPTNDLTAYDLYLRALPYAVSAQKDGILGALGLLERAVGRDPRYASALALAALCHQFLCVNGWSEDEQASRAESLDLAQRGLRCGEDDAEVLATAGYVLGYFGEDINAAISLIERSLELNPSYARGWVRIGWLRVWAGEPDVAIGHFENATRLSPRELVSHNLLGIGVAHFFAGRWEHAKAMLLRSLQEHPGWVPTSRFLAACYAHLGRLDETRAIIEQLRALTSVVVPSADHWRNLEHRELFLSGLRMAAGEAT